VIAKCGHVYLGANANEAYNRTCDVTIRCVGAAVEIHLDLREVSMYTPFKQEWTSASCPDNQAARAP